MSYDPESLAGVPEHGRERMAELKRGIFSSDLSVDEFLLVKSAGFEPLGFVVGSSIYHIGYQQSSWRQSQEMAVLTQAMYSARELAMTRMEEEADQLGADGIVGVRLEIGRYEWGADMAEFIALGTAVKSDLSGQDFYKLLASGHRPVSMVMGSCVYHVAHQSMWKTMRQIGQNVELTNFTQALYDARELAMERMQREAEQVQAEGIVAVRLEERSHGWGSHVIEFFAIGTAIVPIDAQHEVLKPTLTLPLDG
jgi:uncharacterized protein YbjQ (UPF0145 family)